MPFISFIVPVYNIQRFLPACVESVLTQDFNSWEIILIDDFSNDGSKSICEHYSATDQRIRFLPLSENSGPGIARNTGLAVAEGDYICFLDGDDTIAADSLAQLFQAITRLEYPDMLKVGHVECFGRSQVIQPPIAEPIISIVPPDEFLSPYLSRATVGFRAWEFLFKREQLCKHKIAFNHCRIWEDNDFVMRSIFAADRVAEITYPFYQWRIRLSGTLTSAHASWWDQILGSAISMFDYNCSASLHPWQKEWVLRCVISCIIEFEAVAGAIHPEEFQKNGAVFTQIEERLEKLEQFAVNEDLISFIKSRGGIPGALAFREKKVGEVIRLLGGCTKDHCLFGFPATRKTARLLAVLEANGFNITGLMDNNHEKQGLMLDGLPIFSPDLIPLHYDDYDRLLVIISTSTETTGKILGAQLSGYGMKEGQHFVVT